MKMIANEERKNDHFKNVSHILDTVAMGLSMDPVSKSMAAQLRRRRQALYRKLHDATRDRRLKGIQPIEC